MAEPEILFERQRALGLVTLNRPKALNALTYAMVLAGGLTPASVGAAVALVRPEAVDVSSGVERLPGIKDPDKIMRFLEAACGHDAQR